MDSLGDAQVPSALDASSAYWQIKVDANDKDKSACSYHYGFYQFTRLLYGLRNASVILKRGVNNILCTVKWQFALVYLENIVVFRETQF